MHHPDATAASFVPSEEEAMDTKLTALGADVALVHDTPLSPLVYIVPYEHEGSPPYPVAANIFEPFDEEAINCQ